MKRSLFLVALSMIMLFAATFVSAQNADANKAYKEELAKMMKASGALTAAQDMVPQIVNMMKQSAPTVDDSFWESFATKWKAKFADKMVELYVPIYQKYLTLEDLKKIVAFYETPAGKKLGEATPKMTMESMELGQKLGTEIAGELQKELEARGYK